MNYTNWQTLEVPGVCNLKEVDDKLLFAGKIDSIEAVKELVSLGADTFIDLKGEEEHLGSANDKTWVHQCGVNYFNFPVSDLSEDINFEFHQKMKALISSSRGKVVVYCMSSNRVGYWFGRYLAEIVGLHLNYCYDYALKAGMCSESAITQLKKRFKIA